MRSALRSALASLANVLTATLALVGNLFYVLVYTRWLKRSTPQNIVIGGAAGAVPPLVGYAAATGNLALPALLLRDRLLLDAAALLGPRAPHPPRLRGGLNPDAPRRTRGAGDDARQIVIYSFVLVAVTLLLVAWRTFGFVYLASAIALGAWSFVVSPGACVRSRRRRVRAACSTTRWPTWRSSSSPWPSTRC